MTTLRSSRRTAGPAIALQRPADQHLGRRARQTLGDVGHLPVAQMTAGAQRAVGLERDAMALAGLQQRVATVQRTSWSAGRRPRNPLLRSVIALEPRARGPGRGQPDPGGQGAGERRRRRADPPGAADRGLAVQDRVGHPRPAAPAPGGQLGHVRAAGSIAARRAARTAGRRRRRTGRLTSPATGRTTMDESDDETAESW
jgi:hypothetical protein